METCVRVLVALVGLSGCALAGQTPDASVRTNFLVKYVASGVIYLDGGRNSGLARGMKLSLKRLETVADSGGKKRVAQWTVVGHAHVDSIAEVSAVCEVLPGSQPINAGDTAILDVTDAEQEIENRELSSSRKYPQIITFTEGNPLEDELRAAVPKPPLPEINRTRGRIGFEYGGLQSAGPFSSNTSQLGMVMRIDTTRIAGTYWNLDGYWRGRMDARSGASTPQTVNDLLNRTYHLGLTYANPNSQWVAGFGRLYLPWASSLDTLDGGYFGRKFGKVVTAGIFAGSTPDPSSWDYNPNRRIAGSFINFEGGAFDDWRYTSTFGLGLSTLGWTADKQFLFTENGVFYKQVFSIYESLEADRPHLPNQAGGNNFTGISRSFVTVRVKPARRFTLDLNHNYFREIPTFDLALVSTGLVDKLLFQGFSAGARVDLPYRLTVYNSLGRSSKTGDAKSSWNQMYGVTLGSIWRTGIRGDARYSKFDSSFGSGDYYSLSLSRDFGDAFRCEVTAGRQNLVSIFTRDSSYRTLGTQIDWFPKGSFYLDGGFTQQQGTTQNYSQWYFGFGYRFDSVRKRFKQAEK
ncbi:MAG TPA: hypothetical protein VFL79_03275 [Terriglobia bacterium]|nr:hypothetical protein [Terriglobia bacterium]